MASSVAGSVALPQPSRSTTVGELATALKNISTALSDAQIVSQPDTVDGWLGESAAAHASEAWYVRQAIARVQDVLANGASAYEQYQSTYDSLAAVITSNQETWDEYIASYKAQLELWREEEQAARNAATRDGYEFDSSSWDQARATLKTELGSDQQEIAKTYNLNVEAVDEAAASASNALAGAIGAIIPQAVDSNGNPQVPSRGDLGVALFGQTNGLLAAEAFMADAVEDVPDAVSALDAMDDDGEVTQEELEKFYSTYGERLTKDPYFATLFADQFGPDKIEALGDYWLEDGYIRRDESEAAFRNVYGALGAAMMIASGGTSYHVDQSTASAYNPSIYDNMWTAWNAHANDLQVGGTDREDWLGDYNKRIVEAGRSDPNPYSTTPQGYALLAQAWGLAAAENPGLAFGDSFLNGPDSPAQDLLKWDNEMKAAYQYGMMPPISGEGAGWSWDPVHNFTLGLDGNPDAVRTFLSTDVDLPWSGNMNITEYLVGGRTNLNTLGVYYPDFGHQLGYVIDEVTSGSDAQSTPEAATVVNGFLRGYTSGLQSPIEFENGQSYYGYMNSALRNWTGSILEEYVDDLASQIHHPTGEEGSDGAVYSPTDGQYHLTLTDDLRERITDGEHGLFKDLAYDSSTTVPDSDLGKDDGTPDHSGFGGRTPALEKLALATAANMRAEQVQAGLVEDAQTVNTLNNSIAAKYGTLLTHIELADNQAYIAEGGHEDRKNSLARNALDYVYNEIPLDKVKVPGFTTAMGDLKDWTYDSWLPTDNAANRTLDAEGSLRSVQDAIDDVYELNNADVINEGNRYDREGLERPTVQNLGAQEYAARVGDKDATFVDANGDVHMENMTPDQREAYRQFMYDIYNGEGINHAGSYDSIRDAVQAAWDDSQR